ncbi:tyrosine-type recombinase/integrase [Vibrio rumoiensis]|uniref:tyrosine-type recombinase/integrase n=1 Tax=Vibrio rumoiensis TaxID=76258 RepID=UPI003AA816C4
MRKNIPLISDPVEIKKSTVLFSNPIGYQDFLDITHDLYSHNSLLSMVNDWNRFVAFCSSRHVSPLPASITAIRLFLEQESRQRKFASIRRYSLTIGLVHRLHSLPDPVNHRQIHFTLSALRNMKKGDAAQATPFTEKHLNEIFHCLEKSDSVKDLRDLLIYSLMFECILKRGQLRDLRVNQIDLISEQCAQLLVEENTYKLSRRTSLLIKRWFAVLGDDYQGALFCRIDKHGNLGSESLNDSSIYRVFRRASEILKLPDHLAFSGQSSRVGATQDLYKKGYNLRQIQQLGRWTSAVMPAQYIGKHALSESEQLLFKKIKSWD